MRGIRRDGILNENIMAAVGMKASRDKGVWVVVRGSVIRAEFKYRGHSPPLRCSCHHVRSGKSGVELREIGVAKLGLERTRVTGRPAFWRVSMNGVNALPVSPLPEYVSSCNWGNNSRGCSPSSNRRQRESSQTSPSPTCSVFTLLNDLRSLCHSVRPTSSYERLCWSHLRVRCSTVENV